MTNNLALWDRFSDIDPKFTKPITGKAYRGTSPNPHYVIRCLTEMFGPVGSGFGWDVEAEGFQQLGDENLHWCRVRFWHSDRKNGFSAYGQTKALMKTKNGLMLDEDAPKKSLTDAITKAASQVGIGANIFLGRWDDSKYVAEVNAEYRKDDPATPAASKQPSKADHALCDRMIAGVREYGPGVASDQNFAKDLAALRSNAPELAARVDAEIETKTQGKAA